MAHLQKKCGFAVENISPGIYHVGETGFPVYIIVTQLLPPEEYLYLYCVADEIREPDLRYVERMEHDYRIHRNDEPRVYGSYIRQLQNAYGKAKGRATMAAAKKVKSIYEMDIVELIDENERQRLENEKVISRLIAQNARENERQKNIFDMNIAKLTSENERQKDIFDMNIADLARENEKALSSQAAAYEQRIAELEEQIRQLSK